MPFPRQERSGQRNVTEAPATRGLPYFSSSPLEQCYNMRTFVGWGSFELQKDPGRPGFLLLSFKEDQQRVLRLPIDKYGDRIEPSAEAYSWAKEGVLDVESEDT